MMKIEDNRKDIAIFCLIITIAIIAHVPTMNYPAVGDQIEYIRMAYAMLGEGSFWEHVKYPPVFPALIAISMLVFSDPALSSKLVNIIFGGFGASIAYLFLRRLDAGRAIALLLSLSIIFNPWYFYFTGVIGLSEGAAACFFSMGLLLFYLDLEHEKKSFLLLAGMFFSLSILTRLSFIAILPVFYLYLAHQFIKKKRRVDILLFGLITGIPLFIWQVLKMAHATESQYASYFSQSIISYPHGLVYFVFIVFPMAFLLLWPFYCLSLNDCIKQRKIYWIITALIMAVHTLIVILAWDLVNHIGLISNPWSLTGLQINFNPLKNAIFAVRYFVPFIPIATVLAARYLLDRRIMEKRIFRIGLMVYVSFLIILSAFYSYGSVQNTVGAIFPIPSTYVQQSDKMVSMVNWIRSDQEAYGNNMYFILMEKDTSGWNISYNVQSRLDNNDIEYKVGLPTNMREGYHIITDMQDPVMLNQQYKDATGEDSRLELVFATRGSRPLLAYRTSATDEKEETLR